MDTTLERNKRTIPEIELEEAFEKLDNLTKEEFSERYEKKTLLGKGYYGKVFSALDKRNKKVVALKFIDISSGFTFLNSIDMVLKKRIKGNLAEYYISKSLDHPNILKYYDIFTLDGAYFKRAYLVLSFQFIKGKSAEELIVNDKVIFRGPVFLNLMAQFLDALLYLKQRNIYHGDIMPRNLMISNDYKKLYIIDYGFFCILPLLGSRKDFLGCDVINKSFPINKDIVYSFYLLSLLWVGGLSPLLLEYSGENQGVQGLLKMHDDTDGLTVIGKETPEQTKKIAYILENMTDANLTDIVKYARKST